jgi:hypothetical protein
MELINMENIFNPDMITASMLGVPIIFVVIGVVTLMRKLGVTGKGLLIASMVWGTGIGVCYQIAVNNIPNNFGGWFGYAIYGMGIGLLASLFYDSLKDMLNRGLEKMIDQIANKFMGDPTHPGLDLEK